MPIIVKRTVTLLMPDGSKLIVPAESTMEQSTDVTIICDGPRCAAHNGTDKPTTISFNEEQVKKDVDALPDAYARLLKLSVAPFAPQELALCCPTCVKDFITYTYISPKSPKEQAIEMRNNNPQPVQEPLPFNPKDVIGASVAVEGLNPPGPKYL